MCDRRLKWACRGLIVVLVCSTVAGCHTPKHSNVLMFATTTKGGIDISYDPKTQEPNLVVGYKRNEGVWMPLLANLGTNGLEPGPIKAEVVDEEGEHVTTLEGAEGLMYVGKDEGHIDTYSVLASFGAKFDAKAQTGAEASGGLAQYFATGLAARKLAEVGGASLVAVGEAAKASAQSAYGLRLEKAAAALIEEQSTQIDKVMAEVVSAGSVDRAKLKQMVVGTPVEGHISDITSEEVLRERLSTSWRRWLPDFVDNLGIEESSTEEGG